MNELIYETNPDIEKKRADRLLLEQKVKAGTASNEERAVLVREALILGTLDGQKRLTKALRPLNPTYAELDEALKLLKASGRDSVKNLKPEKILQSLETK